MLELNGEKCEIQFSPIIYLAVGEFIVIITLSTSRFLRYTHSTRNNKWYKRVEHRKLSLIAHDERIACIKSESKQQTKLLKTWKILEFVQSVRVFMQKWKSCVRTHVKCVVSRTADDRIEKQLRTRKRNLPCGASRFLGELQQHRVVQRGTATALVGDAQPQKGNTASCSERHVVR